MNRIYKFLGAFGLVGGLIVSEQSFAIFNAQLHYGIKNNTIKETSPNSSGDSVKLSGNSIGLGFCLDFGKIAPIGFGAFYDVDLSSGTKSETKSAYSESVGGLEIMAWAPIPMIKPFVKLDYTLFGSSELKSVSENSVVTSVIKESSLIGGTVAGYRLSIGVGYSLVPTFAIFADYTIISEKAKFKKWKVTAADGVSTESDLSESATYDASGNFFAVGLSLGI